MFLLNNSARIFFLPPLCIYFEGKQLPTVAQTNYKHTFCKIKINKILLVCILTDFYSKNATFQKYISQKCPVGFASNFGINCLMVDTLFPEKISFGHGHGQ